MRDRSFSWSAIAVLALLGLVAIPALAGPALAAPAARSGPGACGSDYPPHGPAIEARLVLTSAVLVPGASGTVVLAGAVPGGTYAGTLFSRPVELPATVATGDGAATFSKVALPADFQLSAVHHLDVYRSCNLVGAFDFCVAGTGRMVPVASCRPAAVSAASGHASGSLPRTGWDHLVEVLRLAMLVLGLGAFLMYLRRRAVDRAQA